MPWDNGIVVATSLIHWSPMLPLTIGIVMCKVSRLPAVCANTYLQEALDHHSVPFYNRHTTVCGAFVIVVVAIVHAEAEATAIKTNTLL